MNWSTDSIQFAIIAALVSALGGTIIYIHTRLVAKVDHIQDQLIDSDRKNGDDHAKVVAGLARVEQAITGVDRDIARHDREISRLNNEMDDLRGRAL